MNHFKKSLVIPVYPDNEGQNDGSFPVKGSRKSQLACHLVQVQAEVRYKRRRNPGRPIRVILHGGRYELKEPFVFGPPDGGTAAAPVIWEAAPGERPVISGARRIEGWRANKINGVDCFTAEVGRDFNPLQLFVDGRRARRARLPKQGFFRFKSTFGKRCLTETLWGEGPNEAEYESGDLRKFRNLKEARVMIVGAWYDMWMRIAKIDERRRAIKFHRKCWQRLVDETGRSSRYIVENLIEALTDPGEWYLDRSAREIHYIPLADQTIGTISAYAPALDRLLDIRGQVNRPVSHLHFENLTFEHCDWHPPDDFRGSIQAGHRKPGAIVVKNAESCVFYGCDVSKVAQFAIQLSSGSHDCRVVACTLHDLGAGGVSLDHEWMKPHSSEVVDDAASRKPDRRPRRATVSDCVIRHVGQIYPGAVGIFVGNAGFNRILHNDVYDLSYSGISVGWTWGMGDTACVDNRIENNHVHHCNMDRKLSDLGLIYTLGTQPGSSIRGNYLHHISSYGYGGEGIYNDEGSSGFVIEDNVIHDCRHAAYAGVPRDVVLRNNIFAFSEQIQANPAPQQIVEWFGTHFERNIITWREGTCGPPLPFGWSPDRTLARRNVLWPVGIPFRLTDGHDLAYWQERGQLLDTLVADPLFADPGGGDFQLRAGSPALAHGFKPYDSSSSGPRGGLVRPTNYAEWRGLYPDPADRPILFARVNQVDASRLQVRIQNPGCVAAAGFFKWEVPSGVKITGPKCLRVALPPGQSQVFEIGISGVHGSHRVALWPSDKCWTPAFWVLEIGMADFAVPRVKPVKSISNIHERLLDPANVILCLNDLKVGSLFLGHTGKDLLVSAKLIDARVRRVHNAFWEGSCFELFIASEFSAQPIQVVLVPDPERSRIVAHRQHVFTPVFLSNVRSIFRKTVDGYICDAIIPLENFGITNTVDTIGRLEISAGVHPTPDSPFSSKARLFGAVQPSRINRGMARMSFL